ncbi:TetR/AcrR family transcriptional regulator [Tomitella fengzijianii]|uniref:TetR/AcrR family transcriptional regulator n=1 Tax=Tomitella fengzijianii TaxID=2597660 RepID=A0A516X613_9ACTN|nr:TetR/AcrR family transcriptional regulator [Tomitella fengzijianii]QDQ98494.1 TetR/AcrR family transcriptional regulator [Tomitella fengzijianii]
MGTRAKRLPRAVREQQMLDSAIAVLAEYGYHGTSMDAIAKHAEISKPMLYLYYGSKEELFEACLDRESKRFIAAITERAAPAAGPRETLEFTLRAVLEFVGEHRNAWRVMVREAASSGTFADEINANRAKLVELTAGLLKAGTTEWHDDAEFELMAVALVGAGEAVANRLVESDIDVENAIAIVTGLAWRGLAGKKKD